MATVVMLLTNHRQSKSLRIQMPQSDNLVQPKSPPRKTATKGSCLLRAALPHGMPLVRNLTAVTEHISEVCRRLAETRSGDIIVVSGYNDLSGIGKTSILSGVVQQEEMQTLFCAMLWMNLGAYADDTELFGATKMLAVDTYFTLRNLIDSIGTDAETAAVLNRCGKTILDIDTLESVESVLREIVGITKKCLSRKGYGSYCPLLVLDDLWNQRLLTLLRDTGFTILVSTRYENVLSDDQFVGCCYVLEPLATESSLRLFYSMSPVDRLAFEKLPSSRELVKMCSKFVTPLELVVLAGITRHWEASALPLKIPAVLKKREKLMSSSDKMLWLDKHREQNPKIFSDDISKHRGLMITLLLSIEMLDELAVKCYLAMVSIPPGAVFDFDFLRVLWDFDDEIMKAVLDLLVSRNLIVRVVESPQLSSKHRQEVVLPSSEEPMSSVESMDYVVHEAPEAADLSVNSETDTNCTENCSDAVSTTCESPAVSAPPITAMESAPPTTAMESAPPITAMESAPPTTAMESEPPTTAMESAPPTTASALTFEDSLLVPSKLEGLYQLHSLQSDFLILCALNFADVGSRSHGFGLESVMSYFESRGSVWRHDTFAENTNCIIAIRQSCDRVAEYLASKELLLGSEQSRLFLYSGYWRRLEVLNKLGVWPGLAKSHPQHPCIVPYLQQRLDTEIQLEGVSGARPFMTKVCMMLELVNSRKHDEILEEWYRVMLANFTPYARGADLLEQARILNCLGELLLRQGHPSDALDYHRKALLIYPQFVNDASATAESGITKRNSEIGMLSAMENVAMAITSIPRGHPSYDPQALAEAAETQRLVVRMKLNIYGSQHVGLGTSIARLAEILCAEGRYPEAVVEHEKALKLFAQKLGTNHLLYQTSKGEYGISLLHVIDNTEENRANAINTIQDAVVWLLHHGVSWKDARIERLKKYLPPENIEYLTDSTVGMHYIRRVGNIFPLICGIGDTFEFPKDAVPMCGLDELLSQSRQCVPTYDTSSLYNSQSK